MTKEDIAEFAERKKRNQEASVKIAKILAESNATFTDQE